MNDKFSGKVRTRSLSAFRAKEKSLQDEGFSWHVAGAKYLENNPNKRIVLSSVANSRKPIAGILAHVDNLGMRMIVARTEAEFDRLPGDTYASGYRLKCAYHKHLQDIAAGKEVEVRLDEKTARLAEGYSWGGLPPRLHNKEAMSREKALELAMQYAPAWIGVDFAKFKNYEVPVMNPYTLKARASEQSIDFYEVAEALNRSNPIAFLTAGSKEGYVLVHKQLLRQAEGKRNSIKLPRKASETDQLYTLRLAEVTSKLAVPGGRQSYPWKFGNAFAFRVDSPSEFPTWKKWAQHVRQARWNVEEREYKVTFPGV